MSASSIDNFKIPTNQTIVEQYLKTNGDEKEVCAVVTRHSMTGLFTLFVNVKGTFVKRASSRTPEFGEAMSEVYR